MTDTQTPMPPRYLRTAEAARHLGLSGRTLEKHRCYGTGPLYRKIGGRVVYAVGDLVDGAFVAESWGQLSYGPSLYAATTFRDASALPCIMFWIRGVTGEGWAGAHSIPYRLHLVRAQVAYAQIVVHQWFDSLSAVVRDWPIP